MTILSPQPSARRPRVLFICGSLNQTTQLHAVGSELPEVDAAFTPYYGDRGVRLLRDLGLIELSIAGNKRRGWCLDYLREHGLRVDLEGATGGYDLVVTCTDLVVPANVRATKLVVVQEGILDPWGMEADIVHRVRVLPRWIAGTALTGLSGLYDRMCVASDGYRDLLVARGVAPHKLIVTGIPNFDDCRRYLRNDFPHRGFVLVCTSDTRETYKRDRRAPLIRRAVRIAAGRKLIFKLHPNEDPVRATAEIHAIAPDALVYATGSAEEMIANASVLITQWSSTVFVGMALGKEVYSNFPMQDLRRLAPVQNGGASAGNIARVCRELLGLDPSPRTRAPRKLNGAGAVRP
jgi:hypothetical protein